MTLTELRERVRERLQEQGTDPRRYTDSIINEFLNDGVRHMQVRSFAQVTTATLTAVPYQRRYALPSDCITMHRIVRDSTKQRVDPASLRELDDEFARLRDNTGSYATHYKGFNLDEVLLMPIHASPTSTIATAVTWAETPAGTMNGSNTAFTLAATPVSLAVNHGGVRLKQVASSPSAGEYSFSGTALTLGLAPQSGDLLKAEYLTAASAVIKLDEALTGTKNGSNVTFTLASTPYDSTDVAIYWNGILLTSEASISGTTVTMTFPPLSTDTLTADYTTSDVGITMFETPAAGGNDKEYVLAYTPGSSIAVYHGGVRMAEVSASPSAQQYTITNNVIEFGNALTGDVRVAYAPTVVPAAETYELLYAQDTGDTPLSADTDSPAFPKRFHEGLVSYATARCLVLGPSETALNRDSRGGLTGNALSMLNHYHLRMQRLKRHARTSLESMTTPGTMH